MRGKLVRLPQLRHVSLRERAELVSIAGKDVSELQSRHVFVKVVTDAVLISGKLCKPVQNCHGPPRLLSPSSIAELKSSRGNDVRPMQPNQVP